MPGLLRPILLLFPERRLVNEQIRALRRVHYCRTGPGIPCKHHQPARTPRADEAVSCQLSAVSQLRSEEHTSELQSRLHLVCRLLLEKKKKKQNNLKTSTQDEQNVSRVH